MSHVITLIKKKKLRKTIMKKILKKKKHSDKVIEDSNIM